MSRDAPVDRTLVAHTIRYYWRHRRFVALVRATILTAVLRHGSELCQLCGRRYPFTWHGRQSLWMRVVGTNHGLRCPRCFDKGASRIGVRVMWVAEPWVVNGVHDLAVEDAIFDGYIAEDCTVLAGDTDE